MAGAAMEEYVLGIDLGTTGCKSMLFDLSGNILGSGYMEYDLIFTQDGVEQDARIWWEGVCVTVRSACRAHDVVHIRALSISSQGIAGVPVDKNGSPLYHALSWLDSRSKKEMEQLRDLFGEERVFRETGKNIKAYSLPQLMWIRNNEKAIFKQTAWYLMPMDYLIYRMTGKAVTDYSMACGTMGYDIVGKKWLSEYFEKTGLKESLFAEIGCMGDCVGTLSPQAARELGLCEEVMVVLGAQDQKCASIGAGISKGIVTISLGTSAAVCSLSTRPFLDEQRVVTCCGLDEEHWLMETVISTAGAAVKWVKNSIGMAEDYAQLNAWAEQSLPGAAGVRCLPFFEADQRGRTQGAFLGMGLSAQKQDMVRAVMEGVAYQLGLHIRHHERVSGECAEIHLFGGGATSRLWRQMIADMTGKRVVLPSTHETACLGAAMIAAKGIGRIRDVYADKQMIKKPALVVLPDPKTKNVYDGIREDYDFHMKSNRNNAI